MRTEGIEIDAITVANEPLNPKNTPSMVMFAPEQDTFIAKYLGPGFEKAGVRTKILLYDHNPDVPSYPLSILGDPAASKYVDGTAFHLYGGEASVLTEVHDAYPKKNLYMTEQSVTGRRGGWAAWNCRTREAGDDWRHAELVPQRAAVESGGRSAERAAHQQRRMHMMFRGDYTGWRFCNQERRLLCGRAFLAVRAARLSAIGFERNGAVGQRRVSDSGAQGGVGNFKYGKFS